MLHQNKISNIPLSLPECKNFKIAFHKMSGKRSVSRNIRYVIPKIILIFAILVIQRDLFMTLGRFTKAWLKNRYITTCYREYPFLEGGTTYYTKVPIQRNLVYEYLLRINTQCNILPPKPVLENTCSNPHTAFSLFNSS